MLGLAQPAPVRAAETRSSRPKTGQPWADMDYGPFLTASIEAPQPATNIAFKGIAIRLAEAFGGKHNEAVVFDTDLLRYSAGWTGGFVALKGVVFDGEHWAYPQIDGDQVFGNPAQPGWAKGADFNDPRSFVYGPLPRDWAHWKGLYLHGQQVVLSYTVGSAAVLERPSLERAGDLTAFARTVNIARVDQDLTLQVAFEAECTPRLLGTDDLAPVASETPASQCLMELRAESVPGGRPAQPAAPPTAGLLAHWDFDAAAGDTVLDRVSQRPLQLRDGVIAPGRSGRSLEFRGDGYAQWARPAELDFLAHDVTVAAWIRSTQDGTIFAQTLPEGPWVPDGKAFFIRGGRLAFDIGWVGAVAGQRPVNDGRWHHVAFTWSQAEGSIELFVDGRRDGQGTLKPAKALAGEVARFGFAAPNFPARPHFTGQVDDVRVYGRHLTAAECAALAGPAADAGSLVAAVVGAPVGARWVTTEPGHVRLRIPAAGTPARFVVLLARVPKGGLQQFVELARQAGAPADLAPLTQGGPPRWDRTLETRGQRGPDQGPYAIDTLTWPEPNPWDSWMRFGGFDFFKDTTRAAICTWSGDVWIVSGLDANLAKLTWRRLATGLFQPLGLKIVDDEIYVLGRDQVTRLHDLNADGEADFYENFNNDTQCTEHFHEFAVDLQTDAAGDFYYMKCARHARDALHPQHGTLMKISRDGQRSEILAKGFRAPNGLEVAPDGRCYTTDQEGYWMPANRLNLIQPGGFHGNTWSWYPEGKPKRYVQPICWIHPRVDRSPSTMAWVTSDRWGPWQDHLLSLSYGVGRIFVVLHETVDGVMQGGVTPLPIEFDTGIMRSRFNPGDGQFYVCGLYGWAGNKTTPGGFYRVRHTGQPLRLPSELHVATNGLVLRFTVPLDPASATDPGNYSIERWNYRWTENYGSPDFKTNGEKGRDRLAIEATAVSADGRTVFLRLADIRPVMQMHVQMNLKAADGAPIQTYVHHSVHALGNAPGESWLGPAPLTSAHAAAPRLDQETTGLAQTLACLDKTGPSEADTRTARLLALHVPAGTAPTPFLPPGAFTCAWDGYLKLDLADTCRFRSEGTGQVSLTINQQEVPLESGADAARPTAPGVPLKAGLNRLRVVYESPPNGEARLRLLWRTAQFGWEPVPPTVLVHEGRDVRVLTGAARRRGRQIFADRLCIKCHQPPAPLDRGAMPELAADAPKLADVMPRLQPDWLARYLVKPDATRAEVLMPAVLHGSAAETEAQARDLVAYLESLSPPGPAAGAPPATPELAAAGEGLYTTLGCVACHALPGMLALPNDPRLSLAHVAGKYQAAGLAAFLRNPASAYRWTRMPNFQLTEEEAVALSAFVLAKADPAPAPATRAPGDLVRGRQLASDTGCAHCHDLAPLMPQPSVAVSLDGIARSDGQRGCLADAVERRGRAPDFAFTPEERAAVRAFLGHDLDSLRHTVWPEFAQHQVRALRCTACHEREDGKDVWSAIEAATPLPAAAVKNAYDEEDAKESTIHRLRPPLTWTGDKLRPEWFRAFVAGDIPYKPRPKLPARMPAFPTHATGLADGFAFEHGHPATSSALPPVDAELAKAGDALIRKGAFGCVDCHAVGTQPALAGADTVTINFAYVPLRLRKEYYDLYLQDPPRLLPGTMMPKFVGDDGQTGITAFFDGQPGAQFEAIWHFLRTVPLP